MVQKTASPAFRQLLAWISAETHSTGRTPLKYLGRLADFTAGIHLSIRSKILASLCIVILLMGTTNVLSMLQVMSYSRQYDAIITNITTANSISGTIKPEIDMEMWKIVSGKVKFSEGRQYEMLNDAKAE